MAINDVIFKSIRSDGKQYIIGGSNSYWLIPDDGLEGIDYPTTNLYTEKLAVGDGSSITGKNVESRSVTLKARIKNKALNETVRRAVLSFFNPKYTFTNYVTYQGVTRWIDAELDGLSCPSVNIYSSLTLQVTFYSAKPFWRSVDSFGKDILAVTGRFGFPYIQTADILVVSDVFNYSNEVLIDNDGDVDTYCEAVFTSDDTVENPKLINGDYYVRVLDTMEAGDVIIMNFENKTITKNGENILNLVDKTSSFTSMKLAVGENTISFEADSGDTNLSVNIFYNKLYLGV